MTQLQPTAQIKSEKELKGWHVLLIMLGFFGVMFAVNGVFLYHAITSFPGEDVKKSYLQGLNYNQTLEKRSLQADRGWQAQAGLEGDTILFRLRDATDAPLSGYLVVGEVRRAATQDQDRVLTFRALAAGEYAADWTGFETGQWKTRISVFDPATDTLVFEASKVLLVP